MRLAQSIVLSSHLRLRRWAGGFYFACLLCCTVFLASCSGLPIQFGGGSSTKTPTRTTSNASVALASLPWCGKPLLLFRDEGMPGTPATSTVTPSTGATPTATSQATTTPGATATSAASATPTPGTHGTPATITDWNQVQPALGFAVYLPAALPRGSCLTSVSGTINDPIFGGSFIIGYLLPDRSPLSFSEAPLRSQSTSFQCSVSSGTSTPANSPTQATPGTAHIQPLQICTGARDTTSIVFSARGTTSTLEQFFNALQPNISWVPAS